MTERDIHPTPLPLRARNAMLHLARKSNLLISLGFALFALLTYAVTTTTRRRPAATSIVPPLELDSSQARSVESDVRSRDAIIFTVTYYDDPSDVRFRMCLNTIRECRKRSLPVLVVDDSPSDDVRSALREAGAIVRRQTVRGGDKGVAFREAAILAGSLPGVNRERTFLCWQEAEKTDMVRHWTRILSVDDGFGGRDEDASSGVAGGGASSAFDVVYPRRNLDGFAETYPIEQYHEETLGNLYLDALATERSNVLGLDLPDVDFDLTTSSSSRSEAARRRTSRLDWYFGPFAFLSRHSRLWTEYRGGDSYDAQVVPVVHALRKGLKFASRDVDYRAPTEMKDQEEGNFKFVEKRLKQLDFLHPKVKEAWSEPFYC